MRQRAGDEIEVFDGEGRSAVGEITSAGKREVAVRILSETLTPKPPRHVRLLQSLPKGKNMDWIIQKAVELGVSEIVPLQAENCVVQAKSSDDKRRKVEKWQRVALEACKQCGQNWMVQVRDVQSPQEAVQNLAGEKIIGSLQDGSVPLREKVGTLPAEGELTFAVGPEGDFSAAEYQLFAEAGFAPVTLGNLVLRVETASFALLTAAALF